MRGRYMAGYNLGWSLPFTLGPLLAGLVIDHFNPNLVWFLCGGLSLITMLGFYLLHTQGKDRFKAVPTEEETLPMIESTIH